MSEQDKRDNAPQESVSSEKKAKAPKEKKKEKKPNRFLRWLKDLKGELKKVTWPTAKDVVKNVGTVILCVLIVGAFIWVFDFLARAVIDALLQLFG